MIWTEPLRKLLGDKMYDDLTSVVENALDKAYPTHHPWKILHTKRVSPTNEIQDRNYLQITRTMTFQPLHWDTATSWYKDSRGIWGPLSVILHINDGPTTHLTSTPCRLHEMISKSLKSGISPKKIAKSLVSTLEIFENKMEVNWDHRSRAGQCLAFHAGEQIHSDMGWDGEYSILDNFPGRVVACFLAVPKSVSHLVEHSSLFNPESPYGLMMEGITAKMVRC